MAMNGWQRIKTIVTRKPLVVLVWCIDVLVAGAGMFASLYGLAMGDYALEMVVLLGLAVAFAAAMAYAESMAYFRTFYALRAACLIITLFCFASSYQLLGVLFITPFLLETTIFWPFRQAKLLVVLVILVFMGIDLGTHILQVPPALALRAIGSLLMAGTVGIIAGIMVRYRENLVLLSEQMEQLRHTQQLLESANQNYQKYAEQVAGLSEDAERNRITREIHDTIGYALTNIGMLLQASKAIARKDPEKLTGLLDSARDQAKNALQESRQILYHIRATKAEELLGINAIHRLVKSFQEVSGLEVEVSYGNAPLHFGTALDAAIFRLVQEGITNAIKHGNASRITVSFWQTESELQIRIWDNGRGADITHEGIGLAGLKERFVACGGRVLAEREAYGFVLAAFVPNAALPPDGTCRLAPDLLP